MKGISLKFIAATAAMVIGIITAWYSITIVGSSTTLTGAIPGNTVHVSSSKYDGEVTYAVVPPPVTLSEIETYLNSIGYTIEKLCQQYPNQHHNHNNNDIHMKSFSKSVLPFRRKLDNTHAVISNLPKVPPPPEVVSKDKATLTSSDDENDESDEEEDLSKSAVIKNALMAFLCVTIAAMAAGLTMGLLSLEVLDLRIKEMASSDPKEREQAKSLVPLIKDHHRLLVTLLLMNALANEALPLFLDKLVPAYVAVILSVTLVLFFGEIIPSAIFTGPNQLAISSKLAPLVRFVLFILAPLAWPIAKILDIVLHDGHDDHGGELEKYDRSELSALVRLQYESRKAAKVMRKQNKMRLGDALVHDHIDGSGISPNVNNYSMTSGNGQELKRMRSSDAETHRFVKHVDEVVMIEGALQMHTKKVYDVMQPWKEVYSIPDDMELNESNILQIYSKGYSRIPVYEQDAEAETGTTTDTDITQRIKGLFKSRQLTVISAQEKRNLQNLPLAIPFCVSPDMNMVDLLNLLQGGKGHMAIVCLKPQIAIDALQNGDSIPSDAQVIGLVTLEDCIEELIQEEIYDEYDRAERITNERMKKVAEKWKAFVAKRKKQRAEMSQKEKETTDENTKLLSTV